MSNEPNANPYAEDIEALDEQVEQKEQTQQETAPESDADTNQETVEDTAAADTGSTDTSEETAETPTPSAFERTGLNRKYRDPDEVFEAHVEANKTIEQLRREQATQRNELERYRQWYAQQQQQQAQQQGDTFEIPDDDTFMERPTQYLRQFKDQMTQLQQYNTQMYNYLRQQPWQQALREQQEMQRFKETHPGYTEYADEIENAVANDPQLLNVPVSAARELAYYRVVGNKPTNGSRPTQADPSLEDKARRASTSGGGGRSITGDPKARWKGKTIDEMTPSDWMSCPEDHPFQRRLRGES